MMYVIVGTDVGARGDLRRTVLKNLPVEELSWENMSTEELGIIASTASLLGDTKNFLLTGALTDSERGEEHLSLVELLANSVHTFVCEEEKLLKKQKDILTKEHVTVYAAEEKKKEESFNIFSLANAIAVKDRKRAWLLLTKAFSVGVQPENIIGVLHWKVRDMSIHAQKVYTKEELHKLSRSLIVMYHNAHRGLGDLSLQLERFVLSLGK